jgi:predicted TIM-barrel enzyme
VAGRGWLAGLMGHGNANEIVCEMAHEVLPAVKKTPVLAGVNGTDPLMIPDEFFKRLIDLGFSGVQNFPTVGLIDGNFRAPRSSSTSIRKRRCRALAQTVESVAATPLGQAEVTKCTASASAIAASTKLIHTPSAVQ